LKNSFLEEIRQSAVGFAANTTLFFTSQISDETKKMTASFNQILKIGSESETDAKSNISHHPVCQSDI